MLVQERRSGENRYVDDGSMVVGGWRYRLGVVGFDLRIDLITGHVSASAAVSMLQIAEARAGRSMVMYSLTRDDGTQQARKPASQVRLRISKPEKVIFLGQRGVVFTGTARRDKRWCRCIPRG